MWLVFSRLPACTVTLCAIVSSEQKSVEANAGLSPGTPEENQRVVRGHGSG